MKTKELRIDRLTSLGIRFSDVKSIVKDKYDYEIEESSFKEFMNNIQEYNDIDEYELFDLIENRYYKKISILSMRKLKKEPNYPICDELLNPMLLSVFKQTHDINLLGTPDFNYELSECYKLVSYKENIVNNSIKSIEFKIACIRSYINKEMSETAELEEREQEFYDCARFFIDLDNKVIYMFYNDWPIGYASTTNGYTEKKRYLYAIIKSATKGNVLSYILSDSLTEYYNEYYDETENGKSRKVISHVECMYNDEKVKAIKSTDYEYKHERKTLDAIKYVIDNKGYHIAVIECLIANKLVRIKEDGSIFVDNSGVCEEVLMYVCKEFIRKDTNFD
ncbi:MAG: hypothetical protein RR620_12020 [Clostridium sp.]